MPTRFTPPHPKLVRTRVYDLIARIDMLIPNERLKILHACRRFCPSCGRVMRKSELVDFILICDYCTEFEGAA